MGGISDRQVGFWDISRLVVAQQFGKDLIDACELIGVVRLDCLGEMGASSVDQGLRGQGLDLLGGDGVVAELMELLKEPQVPR